MSALHAALAALADANDIRLGKSGAASYTGIGSAAIRALLAEHPPTPAPEGTERVEWGWDFGNGTTVVLSDRTMRQPDPIKPNVRRTVTEYAPVVGEWEPVEETQP